MLSWAFDRYGRPGGTADVGCLQCKEIFQGWMRDTNGTSSFMVNRALGNVAAGRGIFEPEGSLSMSCQDRTRFSLLSRPFYAVVTRAI